MVLPDRRRALVHEVEHGEGKGGGRRGRIEFGPFAPAGEYLENLPRPIDQVGDGGVEVEFRLGHVKSRWQAVFDIETRGFDAQGAKLYHEPHQEQSQGQAPTKDRGSGGSENPKYSKDGCEVPRTPRRVALEGVSRGEE